MTSFSCIFNRLDRISFHKRRKHSHFALTQFIFERKHSNFAELHLCQKARFDIQCWLYVSSFCRQRLKNIINKWEQQSVTSILWEAKLLYNIVWCIHIFGEFVSNIAATLPPSLSIASSLAEMAIVYFDKTKNKKKTTFEKLPKILYLFAAGEICCSENEQSIHWVFFFSGKQHITKNVAGE